MSALTLRPAAAALVVGGLLMGLSPVPLADFGCRPAFTADRGLEETVEIQVACAEVRADRQNVAGALMVGGVALGLLSWRHGRGQGAT